MAPYLADREWDVTVYGRPGSTKPDDTERDVRVQSRLTWGFETRSLSTLTFGLTAIFHAFLSKPDVALVMNVANGYWLPLLRLRGIPVVVNVDGIEWDRAKWSRLAKAVFRGGARLTALFANEIVVDSVEIGRRWRNEFGRNGTFIAYGGDKTSDLPLEEGLSHRGYVLVVARFVPENSVPEFLAAAGEIAQHWPIVIVGSSGYGGELDDSVRNLASKYGNVHWLGHLSDDRRLLSLWQHAGAYFHGHSVGGTNPALVQAMACGAPIIARDTVYNREVLGGDAIFVEPDALAIAEAVIDVMGKPELMGRLSADAQNRAQSAYTWALVCSKYEAILAKLSKATS